MSKLTNTFFYLLHELLDASAVEYVHFAGQTEGAIVWLPAWPTNGIPQQLVDTSRLCIFIALGLCSVKF
jgi:hypothetical protein